MSTLDTSIQPNSTKRTRRYVVIASLIVATLLFGGCSLVVFMGITTPVSSLDVPRSMWVSASVSNEQKIPSLEDKEGMWGESWEEIMGKKRVDESQTFLSDPLKVVEGNNRVDVLYFIAFDDPVEEFIIYRFAVNGGKVTQKSEFSTFASVDLNRSSGPQYRYDTEEEKVGEYLISCIRLSQEQTTYPFAYFGVSLYPDIDTMTILGENPDGVVEYTYDDVTYYFWHYDELDITSYLLDHPDFDFSNYTLRQLIEVLDIQAP